MDTVAAADDSPKPMDGKVTATGHAEAIPLSDPGMETLRGMEVDGIAETLNLAFDKHLLLKRILEIAVTTAGGDDGSIMLLDESGEYLKVAAATGLSDKIIRSTRQRIGEGLAGNVLMDGSGRIVTHRLNDPRYRSGRDRKSIAAAVCAPIRAGNRAIGVLNISSNDRTDAFDANTLSLLERFGVQVAGVILKAVELSTESENGESLEASIRGHIESIMSLSEPLPRRLEAVADRLAVATGASACRLYIFDATGKRLEVLNGNHPSISPTLPTFVVADEGIRGWVLKKREAETLMSTHSEKDRRAIFYIPLEAGELIGLIELESVPVDDARRVEVLEAMTGNARRLAERIERDRTVSFESRRNEQMLRLSDLAAEMMCCSDGNELVLMALNATGELFGADLVALRNPADESTTLNQPDFGDRGDMASLAVLDFNTEMCADVQREGRTVTPGTMSSELTQRLTTLPHVRWAAAVPLEGNGKKVGSILSLFGMDDESQVPVNSEWAVLEKLAGYLARAIEKTSAQSSDAAEGFVRWTMFQDRVGEEYKRANRYGRTFALTTIELEDFRTHSSKRGHSWTDAARYALADFVRHEIREVDIVCWVQEGRIAVLSPEVTPEESVMAKRIEDRWADLLPSLKLEGLDAMSMRVREIHYPRDIRSWTDCVSWIQDPFGDAQTDVRAAS